MVFQVSLRTIQTIKSRNLIENFKDFIPAQSTVARYFCIKEDSCNQLVMSDFYIKKLVRQKIAADNRIFQNDMQVSKGFVLTALNKQTDDSYCFFSRQPIKDVGYVSILMENSSKKFNSIMKYFSNQILEGTGRFLMNVLTNHKLDVIHGEITQILLQDKGITTIVKKYKIIILQEHPYRLIIKQVMISRMNNYQIAMQYEENNQLINI